MLLESVLLQCGAAVCGCCMATIHTMTHKGLSWYDVVGECVAVWCCSVLLLYGNNSHLGPRSCVVAVCCWRVCCCSVSLLCVGAVREQLASWATGYGLFWCVVTDCVVTARG